MSNLLPRAAIEATAVAILKEQHTGESIKAAPAMDISNTALHASMPGRA